MGPSYAYFQGKIVPIDEAKVSVRTHALNYGTGAFGGSVRTGTTRKRTCSSSARWITSGVC